MNKKELTKEIQKKSNFKLNDIDLFLNSFMEIIETTLQKGEKVKLIGFGSFSVVKRKKRLGTNPQTLERIEIPAKKAVIFKAGKILKDSVNKKAKK
jgi:DNA-binding protein HU-beta